MDIRIAHSPDSDDAFMFHGVVEGAIDTRGHRVTCEMADIETLNHRAREGVFEVTALSFHAGAHLDDTYRLMTCGASFGLDYGPVLVATAHRAPSSLQGIEVGIPGEWTSAALLLRMAIPGVHTRPVPFQRMGAEVKAGNLEAGVIIHEGQLTIEEQGLVRLLDLGAWWSAREGGLPVPLGANAVRRDLGEDVMRDCALIVRDSVRYGLEHREAALDHALAFARGLPREQADRFVDLYVNELTLDFGERGRAAVVRFFDRAFETGAIPRRVVPDFLAV